MTNSIKEPPPVRKTSDEHRPSYSYSYSYSYGYGAGYKREKRPRELNKRLLLGSLLFLAVMAPALYFWHDFQMKRLAESLISHGDLMVEKARWEAAADAYYRAWSIRQDPELVAKLAPAYDKHASSFDRRGVISSYQRALGTAGDRVDLRVRLAELLLREQLYRQSHEQAKKALTLDVDHAIANKWFALATLRLHENGDSPGVSHVRSVLNDAVQRQPTDVELVSDLAYFLRQDRQLGAEEDAEADRVMDAFVALAPNDPWSYMTRYRYRRHFDLAAASDDLNVAVNLAPDNPVIVLEAARDAFRDAQSSQRMSDYLVARELFLRLIELRPDVAAGYLGVGDVLFSSGNRRERLEAVGYWKEGQGKTGNSLPLMIRIVEALVQLEQFSEAEATLDAIDALLAKTNERTNKDRGWATASARYLRGLMLLRQGNPGAAIPQLRLAAEMYHGSDEQKTTAFKALIRLGETLLAIGQPQDAAIEFDRGLELQADSAEALLLGAAAWNELGDRTRAMRYAERVEVGSPAYEKALEQLAAYHLEEQLWRSPQDRQWDAFRETLDTARKQFARSWQLGLLEADYLLRTADRSQAIGRLLLLEQDFPDEVALWNRLPFIYETLEMPEHTDRCLARLEQITSSSHQTKHRLANILLSRQALEEAERVLDAVDVKRLSDEQAGVHERLLLRLQACDANETNTDRALLACADEHPAWTFPLERLVSRRLQGISTTREPTTRELLKRLQANPHHSHAKALYLTASWELQQAEPDDEYLNETVGILKSEAPHWFATEELVGRFLRQLGDTVGSRTHNRNAIEIINPNPISVQAYLSQNLAEGTFLPIVDVVRSMRQIPAFARLKGDERSSISERQRRFTRQSRQIDSEPLKSIWRYFTERQPMAKSMHPACILLRLNDAVEQGSLAQRDEAFDQLSRLGTEDDLEHAFLMGQAYQLAGEWEKAAKAYARSSESEKFSEVAASYARVVHLRSETEQRRPMRTSPRVAAATQRLEAITLMRRGGPNHLHRSRLLLQRLVELPDSPASDRQLLARCLEKLGDQESAKQSLLTLATNDPTASNLAALVEFFLRTGAIDDAKRWLTQLESQAAPDVVTLSLRAQYLATTNQTEQIEPLVEAFARDYLASSRETELPAKLRRIAKIYRDVQLFEPAKRWLSILADRFPDHAAPLSMLLVENNETGAAIQRCLDQLGESPTVEMIHVLAGIMIYGDVDESVRRRVLPLLDEFLEEYVDDASLLFAIGNVHLRFGNIGRAIELLRRVTEVNPGHYLAWNNLAALLAEQKDRQAEALETIEEALLQAGFDIPTLVDTKAVVLLHQGNPEEAARLLQEVTSSDVAWDPRFYFHLAMTLDQIGERTQASEALEEAEHLGLQHTFLTDSEHEVLVRLQQELTKVQK